MKLKWLICFAFLFLTKPVAAMEEQVPVVESNKLSNPNSILEHKIRNKEEKLNNLKAVAHPYNIVFGCVKGAGVTIPMGLIVAFFIFVFNSPLCHD